MSSGRDEKGGHRYRHTGSWFQKKWKRPPQEKDERIEVKGSHIFLATKNYARQRNKTADRYWLAGPRAGN